MQEWQVYNLWHSFILLESKDGRFVLQIWQWLVYYSKIYLVFYLFQLMVMDLKWSKLDVALSATMKKCVEEMGFKTMTPVQVRLC